MVRAVIALIAGTIALGCSDASERVDPTTRQSAPAPAVTVSVSLPVPAAVSVTVSAPGPTSAARPGRSDCPPVAPWRPGPAQDACD